MAKALCLKCGAFKYRPLDICPRCNFVPNTNDDIIDSIALSDSVYSENSLNEASKLIESGIQAFIPEEVRANIREVLQKQRQKTTSAGAKQSSNRYSTIKSWIIFILVTGVVIAYFHPVPNFEWAKSSDSIASYEHFIKRFPVSDYTQQAKERIRVLKEDTVWTDAEIQNTPEALYYYLNIYPDGKYVIRANEILKQLAESEWLKISDTRSEQQINEFIKKYSRTTVVEDAKKRLSELYRDFDWVIEQGTLVSYTRYLDLVPDSKYKKQVEKTIIDLEVKQIQNGETLPLPKMESVKTYKKRGHVISTVINDTGYELTVRYSGPDSYKIIIPVGQSHQLKLTNGDYVVAASVSSSNVRSFVGHENLEDSDYESEYYIVTEYSGAGFGKRRKGSHTRSDRGEADEQ